MSEIDVKSPALKNRMVGTVNFVAKMTIDGTCCACASTIDIPGLCITATATGFTIGGFECISGLALDSSRDAAITFLNFGTVASAEEGAIWVLNSAISGTAGSRIVTVDVNVASAAALDLTSDSITNAQVQLTLPVKNADF